MEFSISWNNPDNKTESLSFTDQPQPSTAPVPIASIYGRRFYLQSSTCSDAEVINKVCQLQSIVFPNIAQFAEKLKTNSPLNVKEIHVTSDYGSREFLKTTIPQIEMSRYNNYMLSSQNPYFKANSALEGQQHPLVNALVSKNYELLKQLCADPHFLLINEKFLYTTPEGKQLSISPLEFAIITGDMEAFRIISGAPAFNRETPLPMEALREIGPERGNAFLEAYAHMKPDLIDTSYYKKEFKELKKLGFSKQAIGKLKEYYDTNVRRDSIPMFCIKIFEMLEEDMQADQFNKKYQEVLDLIHHPLANFNAHIPHQSTVEEELKTMMTIILSMLGGLDQFSKVISNLDEKIPCVHQLLMELLKNGKCQLNDMQYLMIESFFPALLENISKENMDAYKKNPFYTRTCKIKEMNLANLTLASRANLVTLLGKPSHKTFWRLSSPNQAWKWRTQEQLEGGQGGNDMDFFLMNLKMEVEKSHKSLANPLKIVLEGINLLHHLTISKYFSSGIVRNVLKVTEKNKKVINIILQSIHNPNEITYLPFHTRGHTQALLLYQGHYIVCDRRRSVDMQGEITSEAQIKIYSYKNPFPVQLLWVLMQGDELAELYLEELHKEKTINGSLIHEVSLKPQKYDNCPWASDVLPAIQVAHQLQTNPDQLLKEGKFDAEVQSRMHQLTHIAKKIAVKDYALYHQLSHFESVGLPDKELTGKALLYTLYKVAIKHPDPEYAAALDTLIYSGLAISPANVCMAEYAEADQERMKHRLETRYALKGIKEYLMELGYDNLEKLSDAEAFLTYLTNDRPSNVVFPRYLLN